MLSTDSWRHRPRRSRHSALLILVLTGGLTTAYAQEGFDCRVSLNNGKEKYDLTSLAGEHSISRERVTPPTRFVDTVHFDLCSDLPIHDGVDKNDQCPSGTRACLVMNNKKDGQDDRVVAAIPLAISEKLQPEVTSSSSPKGLSIILHGGSYPETDPLPQSLNLTLLCDSSGSEPKFLSYFGKSAAVEWRTPVVCKSNSDDSSSGGDKDDENGEENNEHVGSGVGWFFLLLLLAFVAYFVLGAYYNYSTYGASGLDLIPHRDFWRDVPYVLRDIVSHLCSAIRPSRSGYIAV